MIHILYTWLEALLSILKCPSWSIPSLESLLVRAWLLYDLLVLESDVTNVLGT